MEEPPLEVLNDQLWKLLEAASEGDLSRVRLFATEENVNKSCEFKGRTLTPLASACLSGHTEITEFLLGLGADVSVQCDESAPLHLACEEGHVVLVETLLNHGANIEERDWYGRTALHRACDAGQDKVVRTLLAHGADICTMDDEHWTPLHISRNGCVAQALLENGANVNARDLEGFTALSRMSLSDDADRLSLLLDYGAGTGICGLLHTMFDKNCTKTVLMCCYSMCHEEIFQEWLHCFEKHFIKSNLAGKRFQVCGKPVDPPEAGVDWNQSERDAYAELCLGELQRMKIDTIRNTSVTYYSLLQRNISDLRGQRILDNVNWDYCHLTYPIYANMIRCSYQTLRRFFLKDQSLGFFLLTPVCLLPECAEMVLDHLPDKDLETLASVIVL